MLYTQIHLQAGCLGSDPPDLLCVKRKRKQLFAPLLNDQQIALEVFADDKPASAAAVASTADASTLHTQRST
ncbi:MAG: hypothetical protein R2881_06055 [Eubacteriales bacterium]